MTSTKLIPASYAKLVSAITLLYTNARKTLVEAYWKIGQKIVEVEQDGAVRAAYGNGLLKKLSEDLSPKMGHGFSERNLQRMRNFYRAYPISPTSAKLTWSQHVELLSLGDKNKRPLFIRQAERDGLNTRHLRELVHREAVRDEVAQNLKNTRGGTSKADSQNPVEFLTPRRGTLYTYRILDPKTVPPKEAGLLLVDLGFSCYRDLDALTSKTLKPEDIVESVKTRDDHYTLKPFFPPDSKLRPQNSLYTYKATVEKIVDGDTLRVVVDLGFNTRTRQYLRLRGIDCPEKDTEEGKRAADFVRTRIKAAEEILLTSSHSDKYDRYLADVFFVDQNGEERSLNNLLLGKGLAVRAGE